MYSSDHTELKQGFDAIDWRHLCFRMCGFLRLIPHVSYCSCAQPLCNAVTSGCDTRQKCCTCSRVQPILLCDVFDADPITVLRIISFSTPGWLKNPSYVLTIFFVNVEITWTSKCHQVGHHFYHICERTCDLFVEITNGRCRFATSNSLMIRSWSRLPQLI